MASLAASTRDHSRMVGAIVATYHAATAGERALGAEWYADAGAAADALAAGTDGRITREQAAGVIAALSPRVTWAYNLRAAAILTDAYILGIAPPRLGLPANVATALRILRGEQAAPHGRKTAAFMRAILGDGTAVVVDVWAARVATGHPVPSGMTIPDAAYRRMAAAYTDAAAIIGTISPRDLQATTWIVRRGRAD